MYSKAARRKMQAGVLIAACLLCAGVKAFTPAEQPKRMKSNVAGMKSDFADFIVNPNVGPQYISNEGVLMPSESDTVGNFYEILGVRGDADAETIKKEYRKLAMKYHPDSNPEVECIDKFQEINRAYEVLRDPELRKIYDWYGEFGIGTGAYSDDVSTREAEEFYYEEVKFGDISSSFGDKLDPKGGGGFQARKDSEPAKAPARKRRYRPQSIKKAKLEKTHQKWEGSRQKDKKAKSNFGSFYGAFASKPVGYGI